MGRNLIVAMSANRVIGCRGGLPWRLPADLRRFKRLTMGHTLIMGRRTYESLGRPLPGRTSIVLTRQTDVHAAGVLAAATLEEALRLAEGAAEVFIIGGGEVYRQSLARVARIYLTLVRAEVEGDTFFPPLQLDDWLLVERCDGTADEQHDYDYSFLVYDRRRRE